MKRHLVALVRDHSGSMVCNKNAAMEDYNRILKEIQENAPRNSENLLLQAEITAPNGHVGPLIALERHRPLRAYPTYGGTPLWRTLEDTINALCRASDGPECDETFLVQVFTDGHDTDFNGGTLSWRVRGLADRIKSLVATDKWTFVFRVPPGMGNLITSVGIPAGNVQEWGLSAEDLRGSTEITGAATRSYYASGMKNTKSFYQVDLAGVDVSKLRNVSSDFLKLEVDKDTRIDELCEKKTRQTYLKGLAFYQLVKTEKLQAHEEILVLDRRSGAIFGGRDARTLLGLPEWEDVSVKPGDLVGYDIYVQSTSLNRKLTKGTSVLYRK